MLGWARSRSWGRSRDKEQGAARRGSISMPLAIYKYLKSHKTHSSQSNVIIGILWPSVQVEVWRYLRLSKSKFRPQIQLQILNAVAAFQLQVDSAGSRHPGIPGIQVYRYTGIQETGCNWDWDNIWGWLHACASGFHVRERQIYLHNCDWCWHCPCHLPDSLSLYALKEIN